MDEVVVVVVVVVSEEALRVAAWVRYWHCSGDTSCTSPDSPSCPDYQTDHTLYHICPDSLSWSLVESWEAEES